MPLEREKAGRGIGQKPASLRIPGKKAVVVNILERKREKTPGLTSLERDSLQGREAGYRGGQGTALYGSGGASVRPKNRINLLLIYKAVDSFRRYGPREFRDQHDFGTKVAYPFLMGHSIVSTSSAFFRLDSTPPLPELSGRKFFVVKARAVEEAWCATWPKHLERLGVGASN